MSETVNYKEDLQIDQFSLDNEWLNQAALYMKYAELYANCLSSRDAIKQQVEMVRGEMYLDIKANPEKYDLPQKLTEATIDSCLRNIEEIVELQNELNEANRQLNIFSAAREAFSQRKVALESLTKLFISNYYAELDEPPETLQKPLEAKAEEAQQKKAEASVRRRKNAKSVT